MKLRGSVDPMFRILPDGVGVHQASLSPPSSPNDGDLWFSLTLLQWMTWDAGVGGKWLSVCPLESGFGRSGNTASGGFFTTSGGVTMTAGVGMVFDQNATLTSLAYSRSNSAAASVQFVKNGVAAFTAPLSGFSGVAPISLDVALGDVLSLRNGGPGVASNVVGTLSYRLRD